MKKLYTLASLSLFAGSGLVADQAVETQIVQPSEQKQYGREKLSSLRQDYEAGKHQEFLSSFDAEYKLLLSDNKFREFIQMREMAPQDERVAQIAAEWEVRHQALLDERNAQLKAACEGHGSDAICKQIETATAQLSQEEKDALHYLVSLRFKTPEMASSAEEKVLIEIDLFAEYKECALDARHVAEPIADRMEKRILIKMDMLKQMQEAAKSFQSEDLKKKIGLASQVFDLWQAQGLEWKEIHAQLKKPSGEVEKKIASILSDYKTKKDDLYQKEYLAKLEKR